MAARTAWHQVVLALAGIWLLSYGLGLVIAVVQGVQALSWHVLRLQWQQLGLWQSWVAIVACLGVLVLSRQRGSAQQQPWAQGPVLAYVLGGLLSALLLNHGVLPQFLVQPQQWLLQVQLAALLLAQGLCAAMVWRSLYRPC